MPNDDVRSEKEEEEEEEECDENWELEQRAGEEGSSGSADSTGGCWLGMSTFFTFVETALEVEVEVEEDVLLMSLPRMLDVRLGLEADCWTLFRPFLPVLYVFAGCRCCCCCCCCVLHVVF